MVTRSLGAASGVWDQPEVSVALSGMSTMDHVTENLQTASESQVGLLTPEDREIIAEVRQTYASLEPIPCTACEYCLPCPEGVEIPRIFKIFNEAVAYDAWGNARWQYNNQLKADQRADKCVECGECEAVCPQNIPIIEWLATAHDKLAEPAK